MANVKTKKTDSCFIVTYRDPRDGQIIRLKVKSIRDSTLGLSFVALSEFVFETEGVVVNPTEEQMRVRFENVKSLHLSIYSIISVEEVGLEHKGLSFKKSRSNLVAFPSGNNPQ